MTLFATDSKWGTLAEGRPNVRERHLVLSACPGSGAETVPSNALDGVELRELMIGYQAADPVAAERLVIRLCPALLRFLSASNQTRDVAQDILQEFWLRLHRSRHSYHPSEPVLPWIFAIARNTRVDTYRRRRRLLIREVTLAAIHEKSCQAHQPDIAEGEILRALDDLPKSQRETVMMLKVSGMSLEEVARATSTSAGAIKQRAHRAYGKLRAILGNQGRPPAEAVTACVSGRNASKAKAK